VKINTCKRWLHLCMLLSRSKMPLTQEKHFSGWPLIIFYIWGVRNCKFPSTYNKMTPNNFDVWGIFDGKVYKCHMGRLGCKLIFWMIQPICFGKVIHDMYEANLEVWRIIHHVVCTLVGLPYNWITPKFFYQRQP
jgi:hypothetical protein